MAQKQDGLLNGQANELEVDSDEAIKTLLDRYDTFLFDVRSWDIRDSVNCAR